MFSVHQHVQRNALFPELRDVQQGGDDVPARLVVDQDLPLVGPLANLPRSTACNRFGHHKQELASKSGGAARIV